MAQTIPAGVISGLIYGFESTFGTAITPARTFGHGIKVSVNTKNNIEYVYGLGSRNPTAAVAKKFEGSASLDFDLSHGTFFRAVFGSVADGAGPPYDHTYSEANTIPSMTFLAEAEMGTNDMAYTITGAKVNSCTLTAAVGEIVKVRLECPFKSVSLATTAFTTQTQPTEELYAFQEGTLQVNGSTIANVQNFEITINNTLETVFGLGSRTLTASVEKAREYNVKMTIALSDVTTFMSTFLGDSSAPYTPQPSVASAGTLILTFTNGLTSTAERTILITITNLFLDEDSFNLDPNEIVKEDVTGRAIGSTAGDDDIVVWTNNTEVDIANP